MIYVRAISLPMCIFANMEKLSEHLYNYPQINEAINNIKRGFAYRNGELGYRVLQRDADKNILVIAMHEGTEFESTQIDSLLTINVIEGKIRLKNKMRDATISAGKTLTLSEKGYYFLECMEESIILLETSNNTDSYSNYLHINSPQSNQELYPRPTRWFNFSH